MSRFEAVVTKPASVEVTMTITLSMAEWSAVALALKVEVAQPYAVLELRQAINNLAYDMAQKVGYTPPPSDEKEPAA